MSRSPRRWQPARFRFRMLLLSVIMAMLTLRALAADPPPVAATWPAATMPPDDADGIERGRYLTYVAGCHACHSDPQRADGFLSGGALIDTPFGRFFPPNITPDPVHGIGGWTDDAFVAAVQHGVAPDGRRYYPVFPYTSYARLRLDDVRAIKRFLDRQVPVARANTPHEPTGLGRWPALLSIWQALYLRPTWSALNALPAPSETVQAGAYLVEAVSHCGECHSPRTALGGTRYRDWLRGARLPSGHEAGNLTPHPDGIAGWDAEELAAYLQTGRSDMGAKARYEMREFVDHAGRYLRDADRLAIVAYLNALPARATTARCLPKGPRPRLCSR